MSADIRFGTDGWRAVIGADYTYENVRRVADAAGRVFSADMGLLMLSITVAVYVAGLLMDHGLTAQHAALCVSGALLVPATVWYLTNRKLW